MFGKDEEKKPKSQSGAEELKELLITKGNNLDDTGILEIVRTQMTSDLHQKKIARAIEIIEGL